MSNKRQIEEIIEEEEVVGAPDVLPVEELAESFIDENGESMQEGEEQVEPETTEPMLQDGDGSRGSGGLSFDPVEYRTARWRSPQNRFFQDTQRTERH